MVPQFQFSCISSKAFAPFQINHPFVSYLMLACCSDNWQYTWAFTSKALTLYQCNDNNFYQATSVFPAVVLFKMCFIWHFVQDCLITLNPGRLQRCSPSFLEGNQGNCSCSLCFSGQQFLSIMSTLLFHIIPGVRYFEGFLGCVT